MRSVRSSEVVPPYFLSRARARKMGGRGTTSPNLTNLTCGIAIVEMADFTDFLPHQRVMGWSASERVVALSLPFRHAVTDRPLAAAAFRHPVGPRLRALRRRPTIRSFDPSWETRARERDHQHDHHHPPASAESCTQRAATEPVISRTYETLSGSSPEEPEVCGCGQAPVGSATAAVSDRVDAPPRPQRSSAAQASALPASWSTLPAQVITSETLSGSSPEAPRGLRLRPGPCRQRPTSERAARLQSPFEAVRVGARASSSPGLQRLARERESRPLFAFPLGGEPSAPMQLVTRFKLAPDVETALPAVRSFDVSQARAVGCGVESWNQPGTSHQMPVRSHRLPRRVLIGNQADLRDASTSASPCRAAGTATAAVTERVDASPRPQRSEVVLLHASLESWRRTLKPSEGVPKRSCGCTGLALSGHTKFKIGRSGPDRCAA